MSSEQVTIKNIDVLNWGTIDGLATVAFAAGPGTLTCVSGPSGAGKSTAFDAYVELTQLNPAFNQASNDSGSRSGRSAYTYVRGQLSNRQDARGRERRVYLRDTSAPVLSAIAVTWDAFGQELYATEFLYLPQTGASVGDIDRYFLISRSRMDVRIMHEACRTKAPSRSAVRALYPTAELFDNRKAFVERLYAQLHTTGEAMRIAWRVQAGIVIDSIDDVYRGLVLDESPALAQASELVRNHFGRMDAIRRAEDQRRRLGELNGLDDAYDDYLATMRQAREAHLDPQTVELWCKERETEIMGEVILEEEVTLRQHEAERDTQQQQLAWFKADLEEAREQMGRCGLDRLGGLRAKRSQYAHDLHMRQQAVTGMQQFARALDVTFDGTRDSFDAVQDAADKTIQGFDALSDKLDDRLGHLSVKRQDLGRDKDRLVSELADLKDSHSRIRSHDLLDARVRLAREFGVPIGEVPFVAELIDTKPDDESRQWKRALDSFVRPVAQHVIVSARYRSQTEAILRTNPRIKRSIHIEWDSVDSVTAYPIRPGHISSVISVDEGSPHAGWMLRWLSSRFTKQHCDYILSDSPEDATRPGYIDKNGNYSKPNATLVNSTATDTIIGFENRDLVRRTTDAIAAVEDDMRKAERDIESVKRDRRLLNDRRDAASRIKGLAWGDMDTAETQRLIDDVDAEIASIESNPDAKAISDRVRTLSEAVETKQRAVGVTDSDISKTKDRLDGLRKDKASIAARRDELSSAVTPLGDAACDALLGFWNDRIYKGDIRATCRHLSDIESRVQDSAASAATKLDNAVARKQREIERWLATYRNNHPNDDVDLSASIDDIDVYLRMLGELRSQDVTASIVRLKIEELELSRNELVAFCAVYDQSITGVEDTLDSINGILADCPFGPDDGRIRIEARRTNKEARSFIDRIRSAISESINIESERDIDEKTVDRRLRRIASIMDAIKEDMRGRTHILCDPYASMSFKAHVSHAGVAEDTVYSSFAGKSGGEYQELVAFILGSAIMFCLGGTSGGHPAYAPLLMDEAFVKADARYTRRALEALEGFGFQVAVVAPEEKFAGLEELADKAYFVRKDNDHTHFLAWSRLAGDADGS